VTKSYASLQQQIASLQKEAQALKAKEIGGVVARIREAIRHYDLTPDEIFGRAVSKPKGTVGKRGPARKNAGERDRPAVKYRDDAGNVWSGRGRRPAWFTAAIESGKNVEDYLVK
jgi:DNA-binding protein H-NS